jgi:two-component system, cell cycle response regulator DivK
LAMPRMDGWEATRRIKSDPQTEQIPVLAVTAQERGVEKARALACGCDAFVLKPCLPEKLLVEIARLLDAPADTQRVSPS